VQNTVVHHRAIRFLMKGPTTSVHAGALDVHSWEEPTKD
jgi:hypothetical protein